MVAPFSLHLWFLTSAVRVAVGSGGDAASTAPAARSLPICSCTDYVIALLGVEGNERDDIPAFVFCFRYRHAVDSGCEQWSISIVRGHNGRNCGGHPVGEDLFLCSIRAEAAALPPPSRQADVVNKVCMSIRFYVNPCASHKAVQLTTGCPSLSVVCVGTGGGGRPAGSGGVAVGGATPCGLRASRLPNAALLRDNRKRETPHSVALLLLRWGGGTTQPGI